MSTSASLVQVRRALRDVRPLTPNQLHGYCRVVLGFDIPRSARSPGMDAPFDYIQHTFFETESLRDCVVWANRGGGKTTLGAVATLLDMTFKPGVQIRILGGSLEQSSKMYGYLRRILERDEFQDLLEGRITGRRIMLVNGSAVEVLAQSEQSVRGQRVQKLRCDEVELFTPEVWQAAQYVTRSAQCGDIFVRGCIESLSTMHRSFGLMHRLVQDQSVRRLFRWGVTEVLEHCPPWRSCDQCSLWDDCRGRAKSGKGFFLIDDAIQQKKRSSKPAWLAEMCCERPSRSDCVYPEFDETVHVQRFAIAPGAATAERAGAESGLWIGGMDFGFRSPTVMLWGCIIADDVLHIVDEHLASEMTIDEHIRIISQRRWPKLSWIGIDPAGYQRHEHLGLSTAALLKKAGFTLRARRLDIRAGLEAVRARLRSADGRTRLRIDPRCARLIEAIQTYHFPESRPESTEPVKDGSDHACDALRYLIINVDRAQTRPQIQRYA